MTQFKIALYNQNLPNLGNNNLATRRQMLSNYVAQAHQQGVSIFVASEFFFTHHSDSLDNPQECMALTEQELEETLNFLGELSTQYKTMLIVPGTIYWQDGGSLYNSTFAFHGQSNPIAQNDKCNATPQDREYAQQCHKGIEGGSAGVDFYFNDKSCYLQICQDTTEEPNQDYDLSLVPAFRPGFAAISNQNRFQFRILSDGNGRYYVYDRRNNHTQEGQQTLFITTIELQ